MTVRYVLPPLNLTLDNHRNVRDIDHSNNGKDYPMRSIFIALASVAMIAAPAVAQSAPTPKPITIYADYRGTVCDSRIAQGERFRIANRVIKIAKDFRSRGIAYRIVAVEGGMTVNTDRDAAGIAPIVITNNGSVC